MTTQQPTYLTIVYHITHQQQVKHLLEHAEWSVASHSHAIHERDEACKRRDELLETLRFIAANNPHSVSADVARSAIAKATGDKMA